MYTWVEAEKHKMNAKFYEFQLVDIHFNNYD